MTTFREFLEQRQSAREEQAKAVARSRATKMSPEDFIKLHAAHEWARLPDQVWSVVQREQIDGQRFSRGEQGIALGAVRVSFAPQAVMASASPCLFCLRFSKDPGASDDLTPFAPEQWTLRAARSEGEVVWSRADISCRHAETTEDMAHTIATKLVEFYDRYEKACGRDALFAGEMLTPLRG